MNRRLMTIQGHLFPTNNLQHHQLVLNHTSHDIFLDKTTFNEEDFSSLIHTKKLSNEDKNTLIKYLEQFQTNTILPPSINMDFEQICSLMRMAATLKPFTLQNITALEEHPSIVSDQKLLHQNLLHLNKLVSHKYAPLNSQFHSIFHQYDTPQPDGYVVFDQLSKLSLYIQLAELVAYHTTIDVLMQQYAKKSNREELYIQSKCIYGYITNNVRVLNEVGIHLIEETKRSQQVDNYTSLVHRIGDTLDGYLNDLSSHKGKVSDPLYLSKLLYMRTKRLNNTCLKRYKKIRSNLKTLYLPGAKVNIEQDKRAAYNQVQVHMVSCARSYAQQLITQNMVDRIKICKDVNVAGIFSRLSSLFGLSVLKEDLSWFLLHKYIQEDLAKMVDRETISLSEGIGRMDTELILKCLEE
ncbi:acyl-coenzyme A oxidase, peroxisomal [Acrasis kona]|uniref:Acyl-coenzyme A oxidase, peroxisomal n=1 Tax=Acrasis kona TaxID=1008807 RepID=A0AAW2YM97_9EUKA